MNLLEINEYNTYYEPYIKLAGRSSILENLRANLKNVIDFYESIPENRLKYRYDIGKWSIKEILLHMIDTERIFAYRALRIARQDKTELKGFEQDDFVLTSNANARSLQSLLNEYKSVREATISLFESFDDEELKWIGKASGSKISVRAIGYIITGHENHHNKVITERYL